MEQLIRSLHHVTATVADAQEDVDFYAGAIGMRLVKKTVNFDNHNVYHFYYGDERGTPGTLMTTFPYKGWGVRQGTRGAGQIGETAFSVPSGSLEAWKKRLQETERTVRDVEPRFGDDVIAVDDPSGLRIELVASADDERTPWLAEGLDSTSAVRGLHSVTLSVRNPQLTVTFLTDVLGFDVVDGGDDRTRLAVNRTRPGHLVDVVCAPPDAHGVNGLGTVHHVAFAVADEDDQLRVRDELDRLGVQVTPVLDRQYFRSIYFREPGGVLYEIATIPPGFSVDEDVDHLGVALKLPPWEEPSRASIEKGLDRVTY
jgi:glyoxalase family protein